MQHAFSLVLLVLVMTCFPTLIEPGSTKSQGYPVQRCRTCSEFIPLSPMIMSHILMEGLIGRMMELCLHKDCIVVTTIMDSAQEGFFSCVGLFTNWCRLSIGNYILQDLASLLNIEISKLILVVDIEVSIQSPFSFLATSSCRCYTTRQ